MSSYNANRCSGCGAQLQSADPTMIGYTPKDASEVRMCQRCFQLKHYARTSAKVKVDEGAINSLVTNMDFKSNVVLHVVDLMDIKGSLLSEIWTHQDVYFVVNKADLLPKGTGLPKALERITTAISAITGLAEPRVILASAKNRMGVRRLSELAKAVKKNGKKVYLVGVTNAGKSSLVNELAGSLNLVQRMSVSSMASTTLQVNAIQTKEVAIIDTPGAVKNDNIYVFATQKERPYLDVTKGYRQTNFQLKNPQSVNFANLAHVSLTGDSVVGALTIYAPRNLPVKRAALPKGLPVWQKAHENDERKYSSHSFALDGEKYNLVTSGLFLASVKGFVGTVEVIAPVGVLVYVMPAVI